MEEAREAPLRNDLGGHAAHSGADQTDRACRAGRKIKHPAANEGPAVVDGDDDAAVTMRDPEPGAERERTMGRGHGVLIEALARGGPAAGLVAVERGHA